jgi:hypothetical protein
VGRVSPLRTATGGLLGRCNRCEWDEAVMRAHHLTAPFSSWAKGSIRQVAVPRRRCRRFEDFGFTHVSATVQELRPKLTESEATRLNVRDSLS